MGEAVDRQLLEYGISYTHRLLHNNTVNWQYNAEFMPNALVLDYEPTAVNEETSPVPGNHPTSAQPYGMVNCLASSTPYSSTYTLGNGKTVTYSGTIVTTCPRRWIVGTAFSPVGFQWNFRPTHTLQPYFVSHGGYIYTTRPIPEPTAGSFNFTFDFGAGIEWFRAPHRSVRLDYRIHHISNHDTAWDNPGIDNGVFQLTYVFGR